MSAGGPDLFVVCKNCGSEVSPYITECPYCGNRLRKRAPRLDGKGGIAERPSAKRRPKPSLGRIKRGEIPGIRPDSRPYATISLVLLGALGALLWRTGVFSILQVTLDGPIQFQWWHVLSAPFVYTNIGYALITLTVIVIYGSLLEHRHGPALVVVLAVVGGAGGIAVAHLASVDAVAMGGNGAALALLVGWSMQDLISLRGGLEIDGDLLLTAVLAAVVALMPIATGEASWVADGVGLIAGAAIGYPLARIRPT